MKVRTINVSFSLISLKHNQISEFRSYLNKQLDYQADILHNHSNEGEIYRYPLVQFRSVNGKATLFGIGEGVPFIKKLILSDMLPAEFISDIKMQEAETEIGMSDQPLTYAVHHYLPLNTDNYDTWKSEDDLVERTVLLQKVTVGHLLNFCKEMGYNIPNKSLKVKLKRINNKPSVKLKASGAEMQFLCFDITFEVNLILPPGISLGKGKSKGYGVVQKISVDSKNEAGRLLQHKSKD